MASKPTPQVAAMEGRGAYNKHAAIPAAGGSLAIPLLEQAASQISIDDSDRPVIIADYGSSQGKNSLAPVRAAIAVLRQRITQQRAIVVYHADLPGNDFSELFAVLENDPETYLRSDPNVFAAAIGRSFYQSLFPASHVDLGWSSYAAVWLSQVPGPIPGHIFAPFATGAIKAEFDRQAASDWKAFLACRAVELRPGGRLVVAVPALAPDGSTAFASIMNVANTVLSDLVAAGVISAEERARMTLATYPRREQDLLAPFAQNGQFGGLHVEYCSTAGAPDTAWITYERDKDATELASKRALFFRTIFVPSLAQALTPSRTLAEKQAFYNRVEEGLRERLAGDPRRVDHLVGIIVVAKQTSR
jgi:hypothetical protein